MEQNRQTTAREVVFLRLHVIWFERAPTDQIRADRSLLIVNFRNRSIKELVLAQTEFILLFVYCLFSERKHKLLLCDDLYVVCACMRYVTIVNKQSKIFNCSFASLRRGSIFRLELEVKRGPHAHLEIFSFWVELKWNVLK